jgi:SseB protein C-terminal domain
MDEFETEQISFLNEQDGPPERELKDQLADLFISNSNVLRAYLVCVAYKNKPGASVALCIRSKLSPDPDLVRQVGKAFEAMFGRNEHLDMLFLTETLEVRLAKCCRPFFEPER